MSTSVPSTRSSARAWSSSSANGACESLATAPVSRSKLDAAVVGVIGVDEIVVVDRDERRAAAQHGRVAQRARRGIEDVDLVRRHVDQALH
jgi:hypothetical protein